MDENAKTLVLSSSAFEGYDITFNGITIAKIEKGKINIPTEDIKIELSYLKKRIEIYKGE